MNMDESFWAGPHTGPAGSTLVLQHLRPAGLIELYRTKFARGRAGPAAGAAPCAASFLPAIAAAGYESRPVGEFFLYSHIHTFLS